MFDKTPASIGGTARPRVESAAFVVQAVPQSSGLWQQQQRLKSRRRRPTSGNGNDSVDAEHAAPLPRLRATPRASPSGSRERDSIQRARPDVRRAAARVGARARSSGGSTSRSRGCLSSAAPQTIADPPMKVRWQAEEVQAHGRGAGGNSSGRVAAAGDLEVEFSSSSDVFGGGVTGEGGVIVGGEGRSSDVSGGAAPDSAMPYAKDMKLGLGHEEGGQQSELASEEGKGMGQEKVQLGPGIDDYR